MLASTSIFAFDLKKSHLLLFVSNLYFLCYLISLYPSNLKIISSPKDEMEY
jgi:hypothetical protein